MRCAPPAALRPVLPALAIVGVLFPAQATTGAGDPDPVARLRVTVETTAPFAEVTLERGLVLHGRSAVAAGSGDARIDLASRSCRVDNARPGSRADAECVLLVEGLRDAASLPWHVRVPAGGNAAVEIYNANRSGPSRLLDRVESQGTMTAAASSTAALLDGAAPAPAVAAPHLVFAAYYPWFIHQTWDNPHLLDRPLFDYSTEDPDQVATVFRQAQSAGIDALAVSWQGRAHRVSVAFQAAQATGMTLTILMETLGATANHHSTAVDPDVVVDWLEQIVDTYGSRPPYLRLGGRPVIFVYAVGSLPPDRWVDIVGRVRGSGRNPVLIGDSYDAAYLAAFDGEFTYSEVTVPPDQLDGFDRRMTLATRTFNLLNGGPPRISVSTVSPGYDDAKLHRASQLVVDRGGGTFYERQWRAAVGSTPDWVFITSWNEWYENTEIEPGGLYGDAYLQATGKWTARFGCAAQAPGTKEDALPAPGARDCR